MTDPSVARGRSRPTRGGTVRVPRCLHRATAPAPLSTMARLNGRHLDARRRLRPRDYLTDPWAFGLRPATATVPDDGDDISCQIAILQHRLVRAWRASGTRSGVLCERFGISRQVWSLTTRGERWAGETVLAALVHAATVTTPRTDATA